MKKGSFGKYDIPFIAKLEAEFPDAVTDPKIAEVGLKGSIYWQDNDHFSLHWKQRPATVYLSRFFIQAKYHCDDQAATATLQNYRGLVPQICQVLSSQAYLERAWRGSMVNYWDPYFLLFSYAISELRICGLLGDYGALRRVVAAWIDHVPDMLMGYHGIRYDAFAFPILAQLELWTGRLVELRAISDFYCSINPEMVSELAALAAAGKTRGDREWIHLYNKPFSQAVYACLAGDALALDKAIADCELPFGIVLRQTATSSYTLGDCGMPVCLQLDMNLMALGRWATDIGMELSAETKYFSASLLKRITGISPATEPARIPPDPGDLPADFAYHNCNQVFYHQRLAHLRQAIASLPLGLPDYPAEQVRAWPEKPEGRDIAKRFPLTYLSQYCSFYMFYIEMVTLAGVDARDYITTSYTWLYQDSALITKYLLAYSTGQRPFDYAFFFMLFLLDRHQDLQDAGQLFDQKFTPEHALPGNIIEYVFDIPLYFIYCLIRGLPLTNNGEIIQSCKSEMETNKVNSQKYLAIVCVLNMHAICLAIAARDQVAFNAGIDQLEHQWQVEHTAKIELWRNDYGNCDCIWISLCFVVARKFGMNDQARPYTFPTLGLDWVDAFSNAAAICAQGN